MPDPACDAETEKRIFLSIVIPTYNGAKTIGKRVFDNLLPQLRGLEGRVEIIVSDNCSTDSTKEAVKEYARACPQIKYFRNESNLGFDRNCDLAVRRSRGEYVWLLSDDDMVRAGVVATLLKVLEKYPGIDAVYINYNTEDLKAPGSGEGILCSSGEEFFDRMNFKNSFVSTNVFRKAVWEGIDPSKYFDSSWVHMGVLLEALSKSSCFVLSYPFICQGIPEEARWSNNNTFIQLNLNLVKLISEADKYGYSKKVLDKGIYRIRGTYMLYIPIAKAKGLKVDRGLLKKFYLRYKSFPAFWFIYLPMLLLPNFLYVLPYKIVYPARTRIKSWVIPKNP